jgi:hypothetical protein
MISALRAKEQSKPKTLLKNCKNNRKSKEGSAKSVKKI